MKKTIGEKIKEIRMQNNLTMDELAEELGYSSRKIEKGINDISYEKLLLLLKKYEISMSEFIEDNDELVLECPSKDSKIFISFSARDFGNCYDVAHHKMNERDRWRRALFVRQNFLFVIMFLA